METEQLKAPPMFLPEGWEDDGKLPPNWEEMIDEETGRSFFIDHTTQTTFWVDPRDIFIKAATFEECVGDELPFGWESAYDDDCGTYFIDHNTWSTQLEDPRVNTHGEQTLELKTYLKTSRANLSRKMQEVKAYEARLEELQLQIEVLTAKLDLARAQNHPTVQDIQSQLLQAANEAKKQQSLINDTNQEIRYNQEGVEILEEVSARFGQGSKYSIDDARQTTKELAAARQRVNIAHKERQELEDSLQRALAPASAATYLPSYQEVEQETFVSQPRNTSSSALNAIRGMNFTADAEISRKEAKELLEVARAKDDADLNELLHLHELERDARNLAIEKMQALVELHESETKALRDQLERMKLELLNSDSPRRRADVDRQTSLLEAKLQALKDDSERLQLAQKDRDEIESRLLSIQDLQEQYKRELEKELTGSGGSVSKARLTELLSSQASQMTELRTLLRSQQKYSATTFTETPETLAGRPANTRSAPLAAIESTFKYDPKQARTRFDLELELAATRREQNKLESDVGELKGINDALLRAKRDLSDVSQVSSRVGYTSGNAKPKSDTGFAPEIPAARRVANFKPIDEQTLVAQDSSAASTSRTPPASAYASSHGNDSSRYSTISESSRYSTISDGANSPRPRVAHKPDRRNLTDLTQVNPLDATPRTDIVINSHAHTDVTVNSKLPGEDWMFDPKLQTLLHIEGQARSKVSQLRFESQYKVQHLRETQKARPNALSFKEKLAFFTTAGVTLNDDVVRRNTASRA